MWSSVDELNLFRQEYTRVDLRQIMNIKCCAYSSIFEVGFQTNFTGWKNETRWTSRVKLESLWSSPFQRQTLHCVWL